MTCSSKVQGSIKGGVEVVRYRSIDALRMLCAFMIVCIHIPPKFMGGVLDSGMQNSSTNFSNDFGILL